MVVGDFWQFFYFILCLFLFFSLGDSCSGYFLWLLVVIFGSFFFFLALGGFCGGCCWWWVW